jgi:hypothetical protein
MIGGTKRRLLRAGGPLALLAIAGFAAPVEACLYSSPIFSAHPYGYRGVPTRVSVERPLRADADRRFLAVRATLVQDSPIGRSGDSIVIVLPIYSPDSCYYFGFYDPEAVTRDGTLVAYVDLLPEREPSGAFAAAASHGSDRRHYDRVAQRGQGIWVRPRFLSGEASAR